MTTGAIESADLPLEQGAFFADTLCTLAGGLEESVGLKGASTFIAETGTEIGDQIGGLYAKVLGRTEWSPEQLAAVLVDLKHRIGGEFSVESVSAEEIVLTNTRCPFADRVKGRPSLCMMTTTVFGTIAAQATGYASVYIDEAIALGHSKCRVLVQLTRAEQTHGYEFFAQ